MDSENKIDFSKKRKKQDSFLYLIIRILKLRKLKKIKYVFEKNYFLLLSKFLITFLGGFFKKKIIFFLKKGSNLLHMKKVSSSLFYKIFKKYLNINKQITGIIYYSLLLKDSSIFINFFKKILKNTSIKLHKKIFFSLKKFLLLVFKPYFFFLNVKGLFFNVKGKIGVSGNAKKRRYFFSLGEHSMSTKTLKIDFMFTTVTTFTGILGFSFSIFF